MRPPNPHRYISLSVAAASLGFALLVGCIHGRKQRSDALQDERERRFVLIDARRLPEAVVQRVGLGNLEIPAGAEIDEMRETLCGGLEERLIFYQLVVSHHWHYYWLCSQDQPIRAMTPQGDRMLRAWLLQLQRRTLEELQRCPRNSTDRIFSQQHASGVIARSYCDGIVMLFFPDGGEKSFEARKGPLSATVRPSRRSSSRNGTSSAGTGGSSNSTGNDGATSGNQANTMATCRTFGEKAFWQGVSKACAKICPEMFTHCRALSPDGDLCNKLSEHCATLKGLCVP